MAYQVTARKWRPRQFDEVVGQEHITATLKNAVHSERVAQCYLFCGPRGVGKTTTARILAKVLNCTAPRDGNPCEVCDSCQSIAASISMNVLETVDNCTLGDEIPPEVPRVPRVGCTAQSCLRCDTANADCFHNTTSNTVTCTAHTSECFVQVCNTYQ